MCETYQRKFYKEISGDKIFPDLTPDSEEAKQFWESIWGKEPTHDKDAQVEEAERGSGVTTAS